jgi:ParB-like chromosome segregation protein Spo0J
MDFHPVANLFPLLEGEEYERLKEDIRKNGCIEPLKKLGDLLLDGRNRFKICEEFGLEYTQVAKI